MALFLITCVYDEGVYESSFRVVKASSREAVAKYILSHYESYEDFVTRSIFYKWLYDPKEGPVELWDSMNHVILNSEDKNKLMNVFKPWILNLSPEEFLKWADRTRVDGDSEAKLSVYEIKQVEACE
ncbi:hypothetical protein QUF72_15435 [Desulfobacterales bacterium HSG2]|nr:hypothetical protein [Desulfobacterales bacterium HSG2]